MGQAMLHASCINLSWKELFICESQELFENPEENYMTHLLFCFKIPINITYK